MALLYVVINTVLKGNSSSKQAADAPATGADVAEYADSPAAAPPAAGVSAADAAASASAAAAVRAATSASGPVKTEKVSNLVAHNVLPPGSDLTVSLYLAEGVPARDATPARRLIFYSGDGVRAAGPVPDVEALERLHAADTPLSDRHPLDADAEAAEDDAADAEAGAATGTAVAAASAQSRPGSVLLWRATVPYEWPRPGPSAGFLSSLLPAAIADAFTDEPSGPGADRAVSLTLPYASASLSPSARLGAALARNESIFAVLTVAAAHARPEAGATAALVHQLDSWRDVRVSQRKSLLASGDAHPGASTDAAVAGSSAAAAAADDDDAPTGTASSSTSSSASGGSSSGAVAVAATAAPGARKTRPARFLDTHLRFRVLLDHSHTSSAALPAEVRAGYRFYYPGDAARRARAPVYFPPLFRDSFWALKDRQAEVNVSAPAVRLNFTVGLAPVSLTVWRLQAALEESWKMQESLGAGAGEDTTQEFKRMLVETNPVLLAITVLVSLLHSLFDYLAFKNDIAFWRENKSQEGLSMRAVLVNAGSQLVIFLYLLDNDTSWMVLVSSGIGAAIECWKVTKASDVRLDWGRFPYLHFLDKAQVAETETARYDREAFKYLSWALAPLVAGSAVYTLVYEAHKSWYSWVLGSLVSAIYAFGFMTMCPQLYLNYKLKSVAHLPWRMLTYKALNTFVDDLFAFVIKMPTLHRIACFRDDLIFFIYLYQRWAYRTDFARANEFGVAFEPPAADANAGALPKAAEPAAAIADESAVAGNVVAEEAAADSGDKDDEQEEQEVEGVRKRK
jgi:hypothetical protein